jgi:hypothetical protein
MRTALTGAIALALSVLVFPAAAYGVPNEGASEIKAIEMADGEFDVLCPGTSTELTVEISGYYMSRWDTLTGQVFAVENVHIDWLFTNPDGETWTFLERGTSVVREGDDVLTAFNNGRHNHWLFGASIGHRVFTAEPDGSVHIEEIFEAGISLDNVVLEACARLAS